MGLLKDFLGRLGTNIGRVVEDVEPVAAAAAPFLVPGLGGLAISQGINLLTRDSTPVQTAARVALQNQRACPPRGMLGRGFSAPFQAAFFNGGGALAGRGLQAQFQPQFILGRQPTGCPPSRCECPGQALGAVGIPQPVPAPLVRSAPTLPQSVSSAFRTGPAGFGSGFFRTGPADFTAAFRG